MNINLFINNFPYSWIVRPDESLAVSLREHGFHSIKIGCGQASCGACTVWIEDKPVQSCSVFTARLEGKHITTIEGVVEEAAVIGKYLIEEGADQCGFCSPGLIMLILAMKRELDIPPTEEYIKKYLAGNLCRCSGYQSRIRAITKYLEEEKQLVR